MCKNSTTPRCDFVKVFMNWPKKTSFDGETDVISLKYGIEYHGGPVLL